MSASLTSLTEEIVCLAVGATTCHAIWKTLEHAFASPSQARIMKLCLQLQSLKQGDLSIQSYLQQAKSLADELTAAGQPLSNIDSIRQSFYCRGSTGDLSIQACVLNFVTPSPPSLPKPNSPPILSSSVFSLLKNSSMKTRFPLSPLLTRPSLLPLNPLPISLTAVRPLLITVGVTTGIIIGVEAMAVVVGVADISFPIHPTHHHTPITIPNFAYQAHSHSANWFSDTGASYHVTPDVQSLSSVSPYHGTDNLQIGHEFALRDLGGINYFLGLEVVPMSDGVILSQRSYITNLLLRAGMHTSKPVRTPLCTSTKLSKHDGSPFLIRLSIVKIARNIQPMYYGEDWNEFNKNIEISYLIMGLSTEHQEIIVVVEAIVSQIKFFLMASFWFFWARNRRRCIRERGIRKRYSMKARLPKQIEHLRDIISMNDEACINNLRMSRNSFGRLCLILQDVGGLVNTKHVSVSEQVAIFLSIIAHHKKNMIVKHDFKRSGYTISMVFNNVLTALLSVHTLFRANPEPIEEGCRSERWKWFKGCLGALDGTYIPMRVRLSDKARYRNRKGDISVNVLGVCDINMKFIYILTGWEGSAADSRVLKDALTRENGLKVPSGNYYLCDSGYTNGDGFLTPYRGVRYHMQEWNSCRIAPANAYEFFNKTHSKARNVIERSFGLLKVRWAILRSNSFYLVKVQNRIIMACCLLQNFIRTDMVVDPVEAELPEITDPTDDPDVAFIEQVEPSQQWNSWRDNLANAMFDEWRGSR
ncbi:hypothetical protein BUALT_Bualt15G0039700 [Buddleja alternifolia]|uniref:Transposase n=1 Tax=Buddleja alternifolia TaxID=168488 RepID=A0AAV6WIZ3_9LAMI|nr:hypothetical protein BUALT_Bualt15G0039700 [Buddleja alternifolia]